MKSPGRRLRNQRGQGLIEYTLVVLLVTLGFWLGVKDSNTGLYLAKNWSQIRDCVSQPFFSCTGSK
jgi:hypothetical protein